MRRDPDWESRFWAKVRKTRGCWYWLAVKDKDGYGTFRKHFRDFHWRAHRLAYEIVVGPIPKGFTLDHKCQNPACVNPAHLEPVTRGENVRRGGNSHKTHCVNGHPFDKRNTLYGKQRRHCRACGREATRRHRDKQRITARLPKD